MVAVKEILERRGQVVDAVSEDGDVLPVDLAEDIYPVRDCLTGDFTERNNLLRQACDSKGRHNSLSGLIEARRQYGDIEVGRVVARRAQVAKELSKVASSACKVCPLRFGCSLYGILGDAILSGQVDYKSLRKDVSTTAKGNKRPGWFEGCTD